MQASPTAPAAPLLSVLCLSYNHAGFIGEALDSFFAQTTDFVFEIVISDDGSTDGTLEIVEPYCARAPGRMQVLRSPVNTGVTRNFRRALKACRGTYIALCEGDDFWRGRHKLQQQVDFLQAHPEYVMCYHDATIVGPSTVNGQSQLPARLRRDASSAELIATRPISTLTVCFRNLLDELPPELDQAPALDLCLWSLLGLHGEGKYLADIEPAGYRVHADGIFSMQSDGNRHLMTAQSLLCLARVHARQGRLAAGNAALLKAMRLASVPLGPAGALRLLGASALRLPITVLRSVRRLFG